MKFFKLALYALLTGIVTANPVPNQVNKPAQQLEACQPYSDGLGYYRTEMTPVFGIYWYDGRPNGNSATWEWTTNTVTLASSKDSKGAIVISVDVAEENGMFHRYLYKVEKGIHCSAGIPRPGDGATIQVYFASVDNVDHF